MCLLFTVLACNPETTFAQETTQAPPIASFRESVQMLLAAEENLRSEGNPLAARAALEQALSLTQGHPEVRSQILLRLASSYMDDADASSAIPVLQSVLNNPETLEDTKAAAYLLTAKIYSDYGDPSSWVKARDASLQALTLPHISDASRTAAREALVPALLYLGENTLARKELEVLTVADTLSTRTRVSHLLGLARVLLLEAAYPEARNALDQALTLLGEATQPSDNAAETFAEIQLLRGISFFEEGDAPRAQEELQRVIGMPGQSSSSAQTRAALLRLSLRKWLPTEAPVLNVLFIGSSHTIRGNIPLLVEQLAASAPSGTPRVRAGEHVRTGTGMRAFWEEGDARHTARGEIAAEPWDAVVVETFFRNDRETLEYYTQKYTGLVRSKSARLIVYESPVAKATPYPEGFAAFHAENIRLGKILHVPLAPSVHAWMQFLGENPAPEKLNVLYADWIHASVKGAYLNACCIYSALTHRSAEGLAHPKELTDEEAMLFQKLAWSSFCDTESEAQK